MTNLTLHIKTPKQVLHLITDADALYERLRPVIPSLLHFDGKNKQGLLMKTAVKGIFLVYGDYLLEQIFKSKNHPRPGKNDDLVAWYTDLLTRVVIAHLTQTELILEGIPDDTETIKVTQIRTQPIPTSESTVGA